MEATPMIPSARPKSLIEMMSEQREHIMDVWLKRVEQDDRIPSADELNRFLLRDDMPGILRKILLSMAKHVSGIGNIEDASAAVADSAAAANHLESRLMHGYQLPEAMREFAHLRESIVFVHLEKGAKPSIEELHILHLAIDEILISMATKVLERNLAEMAETCRT